MVFLLSLDTQENYGYLWQPFVAYIIWEQPCWGTRSGPQSKDYSNGNICVSSRAEPML